MEDGACCDRVSAGRSRRPPEPPPPGAAWARPRRARPLAPRPPLEGTGDCLPDGPRAGPAAQTSWGWGPAGWAPGGGAPSAGPAAAALSGRLAARESRRVWALTLLSFSPARTRRSGLRAGSVLIPAASERVAL